MADSSKNSPTPTYRGEPLCNARGDNTALVSFSFLTLQTSRRFRPLFRLTALLVIQSFLTFDLAWAGGSVPVADALRGQAAKQSQARTGLEEELNGSPNNNQAKASPVPLLPVATSAPSPQTTFWELRGNGMGSSNPALAEVPSQPVKTTIPAPAEIEAKQFSSPLSRPTSDSLAGLEEGQVSENPLAARIRASNRFIGVSSGATLVAAGGIGYLMSLVGGIWLGIGAGLATIAMGLYVNWRLRRTLFPDVLAQNALHRGHKAFVDGRMEWAVAWYTFALNFQPDFAPALLGYGRSQIYLQRFGEARAAFADFLKIEPSSLGQVIEYVLRELPWERGLRGDLEGVRVWMQFLAEAITHHGSGRTAEIRATVSTVWNQKLTSAYELALFSSGVASLIEGDAQRALEDFQLAVLSYPKLKDPLIGTLKGSIPEWFDEQRHPGFLQRLKELDETSSSFEAPPPRQTGLEEEVPEVSQQTVQSRQKGPLAWVNSKIRVLSLWFALLSSPLTSAMAQAPSVPSAPVSPPSVVQNVQQIENTPRVVSSSWTVKMAETRFAPLIQMTGNAPLTIIRVHWDDRKFSQKLADLQTRYPDKIHLVDLQLVKGSREGLQIGGSQKLSSGREAQQITLSLADFREMVVGGQKLTFPEDTFYVYMSDSHGVGEDLHYTWRQLEPYLNGRLVELERQAVEEAQAKTKAETEAGAKAKAKEETRQKAQVAVERLQKVWQELTAQVQKLKEEVVPLMREVERLKQQPKAIQEDIKKLEEQKRQADQAVKELETRRSAAQAETKKLEEEQARLAKEVERAREEATRAKEKTTEEPASSVGEAPQSSLPWSWILGGGAALLAAGYLAREKELASKAKELVSWIRRKVVGEKKDVTEEPPDQPEPPEKMETPPAVAPTPTTKAVVIHEDAELSHGGGVVTAYVAPERRKISESVAKSEWTEPPFEVQVAPEISSPAHAAIGKLASQKYESRRDRGEPDDAGRNWLEAEAELQAETMGKLASQAADVVSEGAEVTPIDVFPEGAAEFWADHLQRVKGLLKRSYDYQILSAAQTVADDSHGIWKRLENEGLNPDQARQILGQAIQELAEERARREEERRQRRREAEEQERKEINDLAYEKYQNRLVQGESGDEKKDWSDAKAEFRLKAVEKLAGELEMSLDRVLPKTQETLSRKAIERLAYEKYLARQARSVSGDDVTNWREAEAELRLKAMGKLAEELEATLDSTLEFQEAAKEQQPDWAGQVVNTVGQLSERSGESTPIKDYTRVLAAARKDEGPDHQEAIRALLDPNLLGVVTSEQPGASVFKKVFEEVVERHKVPEEDRAVVDRALAVGATSGQGGGVGFLRWMFDPVARALRRFPDEGQQALLDEVDTLRSDARRMAKEAKVNRPTYLNQALIGVVQKATTAADVRQGLTALRTLLEKLIPKTYLAKWDSIPFSTLLDQATQLTRQGIEFEVEFIPEQSHTESVQATTYPEMFEPPTETFVIDNPQSVRLVVQQLSVSPPVVEPPTPPVLDHQFLQTSGILDAAREATLEDWRRFSLLRDPNERRQALRQWIAEQPLKGDIQLDLSGIGVLHAYYPLTALGQEIAIRIFHPQDHRRLAVKTILMQGETGLFRYEVFPRSEFDSMIGPDGFINWKIGVPTAIPTPHLTETDASEPFPQISKVTEGAVAQFGVYPVVWTVLRHC